MKKIISIMLALTMFCSSVAVFGAEMVVTDKITVTMDGEDMDFDVEPVMENDRVLVPFRAIFEALGCNVTYTESDGKQFVTAMRGDNQLIIEIGAYDMCVNGNTEAVDAPAVIKDGRTLVPVRAVSETFGANVEWIDDSNTVAVATKQGQHKIKAVTGEKNIKDENGTILICIAYSYPVIDNYEKNGYVSQLNNEYKAYAESFVKDAESNTEDARLMHEEMGANYRPMEFSLSYEVQTDRKGILSVTNYGYYDLGGAHPSTTRQSRTFDMVNEKELALSNVVNGNDDERHTMVYDVFIKYFEENYEGFSAETAEKIDEEADNVKFYLTDDSLVLYFDVYQVGPYAMQYPTVELSYSPGVFKLDWSADSIENVALNGGNFTNEMKLPITYDYNDYGANAVDRKGDHKDSPYFSSVDFYNAKCTDSLSILPQFKTIQQTSWWSCGVSSVEMVLSFYGRLGDWNEKTLADLRDDHSDIHMGTCLDQIIEIFDKVGGFKLETTYDYKDNLDEINMAFIKQHIKDGIPVIVGWNDWGGHWQVIIGYDDMGTQYEGDDVIIVADSFDTTDHNQDGYGVYGAERFIYNFTFYDFFNDDGHLKDKCFVAVKPE